MAGCKVIMSAWLYLVKSLKMADEELIIAGLAEHGAYCSVVAS
jgi:hypothetical protein